MDVNDSARSMVRALIAYFMGDPPPKDSKPATVLWHEDYFVANVKLTGDFLVAGTFFLVDDACVEWR